MPLAREGLREMSVCTIVLGGGAALCAWGAITVSPFWWIFAAPFFAVWVFTIAFFRDPERAIPIEPGIMVAPADGKITEVTRLDSCEGIDGPAIRISIFLSIFDVHINRAPCAGRVVRTDYRAGEFLDARHPECGIRNESNTIIMELGDVDSNGSNNGSTGTLSSSEKGRRPIIVRQVAGLIARRIICNVRGDDVLSRGQRLGLIKFGSRTDLILSANMGLEPVVKVNDMVVGGETVLLRPIGARREPSGREIPEESHVAH
ncbi:MAG: phosphatidylserine decarboxylase family protein [Planctomycetes bacterium]|nr:phosphatidylserine decarboxylase family protein [Planctomycetota bacterium]